MTGQRILYLSNGCVPLPGVHTLGPDQRTVQVATTLREGGHEVIVSCDLSGLGRHIAINEVPNDIARASHTRHSVDHLIAEYKPDVIYCSALMPAKLGLKTDIPVLVELGGPILLEKPCYHPGDMVGVTHDWMLELCSLAAADAVVAYGTRQKGFVIPEWILAGADPNEDLSILCWPPGVAHAHGAPRCLPDGPRIIVAGWIHPWLDQRDAIRIVLETLDDLNRGQLVFVGASRNVSRTDSLLSRRLDHIMRRSDKAEVHAPMSMEGLADLMNGCDATLEVCRPNLERWLAVAYRTVFALSCGTRLLANEESELAMDLHRTTPTATISGSGRHLEWLRAAVRGLAGEEDGMRLERRLAAQRYAVDNLDYASTGHAVLTWLERPRRRTHHNEHSVLAAHRFPLSPNERWLIRMLRRIRRPWRKDDGVRDGIRWNR